MPVDAALILRSARSAERLHTILLLSKVQIEVLVSVLAADPELAPELEAIEKRLAETVEAVDQATTFLNARVDVAREGP